MDYGNTKTTSMHNRLGSATLSKLAFPGEKQPEFPMAEIPLGHYNTVVVEGGAQVKFRGSEICERDAQEL